MLCLVAHCPDDAALAAGMAFPPPADEAVIRVVRAADDASLRPGALDGLRTLHGQHAAMELALLHAALDDREGALELLTRTFRAGGDPLLPLYLVHPLLDGLRAEPAFREIVDAIGIEAPASRLAAL
jgi:hypothetical protein